MQIKVRKSNQDGTVRLETIGRIEEVMIAPDFTNPAKEKIALCFRGRNSSGIVEITAEEADRLMHALKNRLRLVKGSKLI